MNPNPKIGDPKSEDEAIALKPQTPNPVQLEAVRQAEELLVEQEEDVEEEDKGLQGQPLLLSPPPCLAMARDRTTLFCPVGMSRATSPPCAGAGDGCRGGGQGLARFLRMVRSGLIT